MAFDTKAWLEELGFAGDELNDLAGKFETRTEKLEKGQLRQADYSRQSNALKTQQDDFESKSAALTREMAEWASIKAAGGDQSGAAQAALEAKERELFELQQTIRRTATENGLSFEDLVPKEKQVPEPVKKADPGFDPNKFVDRDTMGKMTGFLLTLPAELMELAEEHRELTGKRLDTRAIMAEVQARARAGKDVNPRAIWEETNDIPNVRQQKAETDRTTREAEIRKEEREKVLSEHALPGDRAEANRVHSPILHRPNSGSKLQRPAPGATHERAVAALRSGKYSSGKQNASTS